MSEDLPLPPVPADIAIVREFVNTTDYETQSDDLTTTAELTAYLYDAQTDAEAVASDGGRSGPGPVMRRGLRRALELNHDDESRPITRTRVGARASCPSRWSGPETVSESMSSGDGVRGGLAEIALAMQRAVAEGIWWRLKICSSDECEWAYYDKSKNKSRNWCEYGCGNKLKMRAYRARQKATGS